MSNLLKRLDNMSPERRQYTLEALVQHLHYASDCEKLHTLFDSDEWMRVRFEGRRYTYDGFLADLEIAWESLLMQERADLAHSVPMTTLVRQVRYCLLSSSINTLSANVPPVLLVRLVEEGNWTVERALALIARIPSPQQRILSYVLLLESEKLVGKQRRETCAQAIEVLLEVPASTGWAADPSPRGRLLVLLAPNVEEDLLDKVRAFPNF